ncbi:MAG: PLP-dependent aspartate aminotransferase family protein [Candidatus Acidiferrales bacterium]
MARTKTGGQKSRTDRQAGIATRAVHVGESRHGVGGPVVSPVVQSATFTFASVEEMKRWAEGRSKADIYTRYGNPTLRVAEAKLAALEEGEAGLVTASGMAAISSTLLTFVGAGEEIIATRRLYGGTYRLMRDLLPRFGIKVHFVESDLRGVEARVTPRTRLLYTETPTNPTLGIVDLRKAAALARRLGLVSAVDNTFATPVLQRPLTLGFDVVCHSATKYLGGHSDVIAGAVAGRRKLVEKIRHTMIELGGSLDPAACYLLIRGMKTLETRMRRQAANALTVARFLERHPKVARVHYPGLRSHPGHALARRQMSGFGAMLAFDLKGGLGAARRFGNRIRLFLLAGSLGGVESLAVLPIYTSHHHMSVEELAAAGVSPGTVRLSIGVEDAADLLADLKQALA